MRVPQHRRCVSNPELLGKGQESMSQLGCCCWCSDLSPIHLPQDGDVIEDFLTLPLSGYSLEILLVLACSRYDRLPIQYPNMSGGLLGTSGQQKSGMST